MKLNKLFTSLLVVALLLTVIQYITVTEYMQWSISMIITSSIYIILLIVFKLYPKYASIAIAILFAVTSCIPSAYSSMQLYGLMLAIIYVAYYADIRVSLSTMVCILSGIWMSTALQQTDMLNALNNSLFFLLVYIPSISFQIWNNQNKQKNKLLQAKITEDRLKRIEQNQLLASALHDSATTELTSIVITVQNLMKKDPSDTNDIEYHLIEQQSLKALDNIHRSIELLIGGQDNVQLSESLITLLKEGDAHLHKLGFKGNSSIRLPEQITDLQVNALIKEILREIYTNIERHSSPKQDEYTISIQVTPNQISISQINTTLIAIKNEIHSGYGLPLLKDRISKQGGSLVTRKEDDGWYLQVKIPLKASLSDSSIN